MSKLNDLTAGNLGDILRRLRRLENSSPLSSSSVGRGRMRFYDNSELLVENGALRVTGTATISGTFDMSGTANFTGTVSITGPLTVAGNTKITGDTDITGPLSVEGNTDITGTLAIKGPATISGKLDVTGPMATKGTLAVEGVTTLKNDLNVTAGGKITAGNTVISPSSSNGGVEFKSGGGVGGNGGTVAMRGSSNAGVLAGTTASLFAGAYSVDVAGDGVRVTNLPTTGNAPNLYADGSGKLYRSTA
ncbi:polymer-forming cytoskeletal protein [Crystallibacter degradans]|uniref:polymer-forming cytoskeletal protein n=1 Tax=Crystallibacter degradans TaxID=2726743 RepID=UPI0014751F89|nr:polymer-forming cytoskeletal protein [Arthrobacter sp. SF27]NMR29949.1 polymer-forming cytoskeletal protein [Arthrobacter sp. SF27]